MYNPVILCITWNFSFSASLSTEYGIEYGSGSYPRKRLVCRMNFCWPGKALSQVVMSAYSVDPEDFRQLGSRWKKYLKAPTPFLQI